MLLKNLFSQGLDRLYRRLPYLLICLLLLKLALDLVRNGMPKLAALLVVLLLPIELIHRWTQRLIARNPRKWWVDPARGTWWFNTFPAWLAFLYLLLSSLIESPVVIFFMLGLLVAGIVCAGII